MSMIAFPPYEPDGSPFLNADSPVVTNCLPQQDGWGPAPSFVAVATALPSAPRGAITGVASDGTYNTFVGTETKLYRYNSGTLAFDDISTVATTYAVPSGYNWSFHQWGDLILATNQTDGLYKFDMISGTTFVAVSGAPKARFVTNVDEHVVLAHVDGSPKRVQWCQIGDVDTWTVGVAGADFQDFPDGGVIRGIEQGDDGATVFQQRSIRDMQYVGGEYIFTFDKLSETRGSVASQAIINAENGIFFLDEDGFYAWSNGKALPIGAEKVNNTFLTDIDLDFLPEVQGSADPINKMVWWRYTQGDATDAVIGYDWQLDRWCMSDGSYSFLFSSAIPAYTLEALDAISASLDALPYSLDSRIWFGGRPTLAGFDSSYQFGFFSGTSQAATLETSDLPLGGPNQRAYVNGYRVVTDATHTANVATKETHFGTRTWGNDVSANTETGLIPVRRNGRLHRFRAKIAAGVTWTYIHGVEPFIRKGGRR